MVYNPLIKAAAQRWVKGFNVFPVSMIEQLIVDHPRDWEEVGCDRVFQNGFPVCAYLYQFNLVVDKRWIEEEGNISTMIDCGFKLFKHIEWGTFFCINGFGNDFFEKHWIPLYEKRGLKWHENNETTSQMKSPSF